MLERIGPWLVWLLFLGTVWYVARPILIFLAALAIVGVVLWGAVRRLEKEK